MAFQARPASPVGVQPDSSMDHNSVFTLKYYIHISNMKYPPMVFPASKGVPLLVTSAVTIPPGSQTILDS
ncbi:hypothetical protein DSO57_1008960 [Entomophthora muscae]|uniref:Uncharacterized protein n=1 Tax=Entomophthora muscae TaxID=34485 RepID=A0ACC2U5C2_9FUNG|nr:hypothetical protein DSO57_1008960 [Entomophthora muscae]